MKGTMIDLHFVVLLITISILIKQCFGFFWVIAYILTLAITDTFVLQYSITWHVLQADMPANVSDICLKHFVACP